MIVEIFPPPPPALTGAAAAVEALDVVEGVDGDWTTELEFRLSEAHDADDDDDTAGGEDVDTADEVDWASLDRFGWWSFLKMCFIVRWVSLSISYGTFPFSLYICIYIYVCTTTVSLHTLFFSLYKVHLPIDCKKTGIEKGEEGNLRGWIWGYLKRAWSWVNLQQTTSVIQHGLFTEISFLPQK